MISIQVGPWFNHERDDQGTYQVTAFGHKLISEAGYADYCKDLNYQAYFMQVPGHSTVLIDYNPFSQPREERRYWNALAHYPQFTAHLLSPGMDYLLAELTQAYGGVVTAFQREFIFLKGVLIIHDRLQSPSPHHFEWLLHAPLGAEVGIRRANASITVNNATAVVTSIGPNNHWTLQKIPLAGDRCTDLDRIRLNQLCEFVLSSDKSSSVSFLVGMKFEGAVPQLQALTPLEEGGREGFIDARGGWSWISGSESGALELDGISAQGKSLGAKKSTDNLQVFATGITSLCGEKNLGVESSVPLDLGLNNTDLAETIDFYTLKNTTLKELLPRKPQLSSLMVTWCATSIMEAPLC